MLPKTLQVPAKWRKFAETQCAQAGVRLTPARWAFYTELVAVDRPLSAYDLIALQEERQGRKIAPLTVYRHLDFLIKVGLVHKIESTHAYVACGHPDQAHESQYLLCTSCGRADEVESKVVQKVLSELAHKRGFKTAKSVVEVTGLCMDCATLTDQATNDVD